MEFKYYRSVEGRAVLRFGTDTFIGCHRTGDIDQGPGMRAKPSIGFVWDDVPVAIPLDEVRRNLRSYRNAVDRGDLVDVTDEVVSKKPTRRPVEVDDDTFAGPKDQDSDEPTSRRRGKGKARNK